MRADNESYPAPGFLDAYGLSKMKKSSFILSGPFILELTVHIHRLNYHEREPPLKRGDLHVAKVTLRGRALRDIS